MVTIFSTGIAKNKKITSYKDKILDDFDRSLNSVLKNLAKSVAADGEGASKFVVVKVRNVKMKMQNLFFNLKFTFGKNSISW